MSWDFRAGEVLEPPDNKAGIQPHIIFFWCGRAREYQTASMRFEK
jgi:hypothetical protein